MSNIAIKGATTGTGTFTIESPATNTDRTLTLPDEAGTVLTSASNIPSLALGTTPVLRARRGASQGISDNTSTLIQLDTIDIDSNSDWDSVNYRYTPSVAGWYLVMGWVTTQDMTDRNALECQVSWNGDISSANTTFNRTFQSYASTLDMMVGPSVLLKEFNGTTDYTELYGRHRGYGATRFTGSATTLLAFRLALTA